MAEAYDFYPSLLELAPAVPEDSILSRTFYKGEHLNAILFSFAEGEELSEHSSAYPAIIQIVSGRAKLKLGQDEYLVEAGAWARMDPKLPHTLVAETPLVVLLLMLR